MSRKARFTITLSQPVPTGGSVSVHYTTVDGTAVAPSDYTTVSGTLTFAAGEQVKYIDVNVRDINVIVDVEKSFTLSLSSPVGSEDITATVSSPGHATAVIPPSADESTEYANRFVAIWDKVYNPNNKYLSFDKEAAQSSGDEDHAYGNPYHSSGKDSLIIIEDRLPVNSIDNALQCTSENMSFLTGMWYWRDILFKDNWVLENNDA